jgi:nitrite reductase/ring-hydroxylating ferredoxin subunit
VALRRYLCAATELRAGELRSFNVSGVIWPVLATIVDGEIIAVPSVCPHEDVSLADGDFTSDGEIVCPGHGFRFDVRTGKCAGQQNLMLRRYPVTLIANAVWVDLL